MKRDYYIIFVVLVYRNISDLRDYFSHNKVTCSHTIVVNSFYDDDTEKEFKELSMANDADFITVPNYGYGAGNNAGVKYALEHFNFNYLIISNADILIQHFNPSDLNKYRGCIIAPKIINLSGKMQNPCSPFRPSKLESYLNYITYRNNHTKLIWLLFAFSRLKKIIFHLIYPLKKNIFSAHGAFVIFPVEVIKKMVPLYNEKMFLFKEEAHVGMLAKQKGIITVYAPDIVIKHKEDGSMKVASINVFNMERQSYMEYYNNWFKR